MNIEFNWVPVPNPEDQKTVEIEISNLLKDIKPCHPGAISITLRISGPLDTNLQGTAKCQCGKILMDFKGDNMASRLVFTEYD